MSNRLNEFIQKTSSVANNNVLSIHDRCSFSNFKQNKKAIYILISLAIITASAALIFSGAFSRPSPEKQDLIVYSANISLTKSYKILDEKGLVEITVTASNIGDMPVKTEVTETLPANGPSLLSQLLLLWIPPPPANIKLLGSPSLHRNVTLEPGKTETISYLASVPAKVDLPPATARYNNLIIESNNISIVLPGYKPAEIPPDLGYFPAIVLSALFGWLLITTIKNGRHDISLPIKSAGGRKVINTTPGKVILVLSLFFLVVFVTLRTQQLIDEKYVVFIIYLLIFGSAIKYAETRKAL